MTTPMTILPIGDFVVRSFLPDDVGAIVRYANDREVWLNLRDLFPHPYEPHHAERWLRDVRSKQPETAFAIASEDGLIGGIGLHIQTDVQCRSAELGYWLGTAFWGRGIATAAVGAVTRWGFEHLDIDRIFASVFGWNSASVRVLEKSGFTYEGTLRQAVYKDGRTTDMMVYGVLRGELRAVRTRPDTPASPMPQQTPR